MLTFQASKGPITYTKTLKEVEIVAEKPKDPYCSINVVYKDQVYRIHLSKKDIPNVPKDKKSHTAEKIMPLKILQDELKQKPGEADKTYETRVLETLNALSSCLEEKLRINAITREHNKSPEQQSSEWLAKRIPKAAVLEGKNIVEFNMENRQKLMDMWGEPTTKNAFVKTLFKAFDNSDMKFTQQVVPVKASGFVLDEGQFAKTTETEKTYKIKLAAPDIMVELGGPKPKSASPKL